MEQPTPISELIVAAQSSDLSIASRACRNLLNRHVECSAHVDSLMQVLRSRNAAISDYAYCTLKRVGEAAAPELIEAFGDSTGRFRKVLMGLIAIVAPFDSYFPLIKNEIENGEEECMYWAANCLAREYSSDADWPPEAMEVLNQSISLLQGTRSDTHRWVQARMTLKHLGLLEGDAI